MSTEIYYFSGTGNSFFAAKELAKSLPGSQLVPMAPLFKKKNVRTSADIVGFVFPIYFTAIPSVIAALIKRMDLSSAEYIFAALTRSGTDEIALMLLDKILEAKGTKLDASMLLNMGSNNPTIKKNWTAPSVNDIKDKEEEAKIRLGVLVKAILNREPYRQKDNGVIEPVSGILLKMMPLLLKFTDIFQDKYYADEKCNACGICTDICPSGKITMNGSQPYWDKKVECYRCRACLNYCPVQAVQIRKTYTTVNGRYSHPYAALEDIKRQK